MAAREAAGGGRVRAQRGARRQLLPPRLWRSCGDAGLSFSTGQRPAPPRPRPRPAPACRAPPPDVRPSSGHAPASPGHAPSRLAASPPHSPAPRPGTSPPRLAPLPARNAPSAPARPLPAAFLPPAWPSDPLPACRRAPPGPVLGVALSPGTAGAKPRPWPGRQGPNLLCW